MARNTITPQDLAQFLGSDAPRKKPKASTEVFLKQFSAGSLGAILKDKTSRIDLGWYVKELLRLLRDPECPHATRLLVIDRLHEMITLGAIQDPSLLEELKRDVKAAARKIPDPFAGDAPLKMVKLQRQ